MDAIDVALVDIERGHLELRYFDEVAYPPELRRRLECVVRSRSAAIDEIGSLHTALGQVFAEAALHVLAAARVPATAVHALGSHGQTIGHRAGGPTPYTWQIGDPHVIAWRTGIRTIADFRAMDVAAGGQGAPLVPGFHRELFHRPGCDVAVVNIGGIANVSLLAREPESDLIGFDCGPGNTLLDLWANRHTGALYDESGRWAASGTVDPRLLQQMLSEPYFAMRPPKSTGRELFNLAWIEQHLQAYGSEIASADVQATLVHLTAVGIVDAIDRYLPACGEIIVCGGGARNETLMQILKGMAGATRKVLTTDALGWPSGAIEACTFAWLAARRLAGMPGNVSSVTGATAPVLLGAMYECGTHPGREGV